MDVRKASEKMRGRMNITDTEVFDWTVFYILYYVATSVDTEQGCPEYERTRSTFKLTICEWSCCRPPTHAFTARSDDVCTVTQLPLQFNTSNGCANISGLFVGLVYPTQQLQTEPDYVTSKHEDTSKKKSDTGDLVTRTSAIRVFTFPRFYLRIMRSINILSAATVEAAAQSHWVARAVSLTSPTILTQGATN
jgi:hypothetical protein